MPSFVASFELRSAAPGPPALSRGRFVAVVDRMRTAVEGDFYDLLGEDAVVVLEAPAHLQPTGAGSPRNEGRLAFRAVAYLRPLPDDAEADAELIVPLFSHN